eukprot:s6480_g3.t1
MDLPVEENIFKLCDFGFAAHDKGDGLNDRLGSPDTVAPEIVVGTKYSMPVDMWSAGVLVYMMLSAAPPFYATTDSEVLRKVRTGSYNLSGEPWDSLPAPPKNLIARPGFELRVAQMRCAAHPASKDAMAIRKREVMRFMRLEGEVGILSV